MNSENNSPLKTKLSLAGICCFIFVIVFGVYHKTLHIGFLLDDFYHVDYLMRAFDGDSSELMKVLFGSWSGPTGLNSFRPLTTIGLLLDFVVWKTNSFGYHLTNLILYGLCSSCVVVLVSQLLTGTKERLYASLAAGLLFVLYPIHPESVAWIIGRVDTQCVLFFLLSLICYFQYRKSDFQLYLVVSFLFFFISLTTKEMAVVLPAVILFAELLLASDIGFKQKKVPGRLLLVGSYFVFLFAFAILRTTAIGTLVGGYGSTDLKTTLMSFRNFLDLFTLKKILFGVNDELPLATNPVNFVYASFVLLLGPVLLSVYSKRTIRLIVFLILFLLVSVIPTFQIWHIYPNLVGSRLFFLGSVPFIIMLSVIAFSLLDQLPDKLKKVGLGLRYVSLVGLVGLSYFWYVAASNNLQVWVRAGQDIEKIRAQLTELSSSTGDDQFIHLIDLPQDDSGAGLIGRPEYMKRMLKLSSAPLSDEGNLEKVITTEPRLSRQRSFLYPYTFRDLAKTEDVKHQLRWNSTTKQYDAWQKGFEIPVNDLGETKQVSIEQFGDSLAVAKKKTVWFSLGELNPFEVAWIKLNYSSGNDKSKAVARAKLLYRSENQPKSWIDYSTGPDADVTNEGELLFVPYRYRNWLLNGKVKEVGVQFTYLEGAIKIENEVTIGSPASIFPELKLSDSSLDHSVDRNILLPCDSISPLKISFDVSAIKGAKGAILMVGKPQIPIAVPVTRLLPNQSSLLFQKKILGTTGSQIIPDDKIVESVGLHQVCVMAIDENDTPCSFLSEPKMFEICPNRPPQIK